ncbi:MAG: hypothetical protein ACXW18_02765 [Pyrinomonadaceae bacterium]
MAKLVDAYHTIQDVLASIVPPNEMYTEEFLTGLSESDDDIRDQRMTEVRSLDDFTA